MPLIWSASAPWRARREFDIGYIYTWTWHHSGCPIFAVFVEWVVTDVFWKWFEKVALSIGVVEKPNDSLQIKGYGNIYKVVQAISFVIRWRISCGMFQPVLSYVQSKLWIWVCQAMYSTWHFHFRKCTVTKLFIPTNFAMLYLMKGLSTIVLVSNKRLLRMNGRPLENVERCTVVCNSWPEIGHPIGVFVCCCCLSSTGNDDSTTSTLQSRLYNHNDLTITTPDCTTTASLL